jgi:hypothetical protein
MECRGKNDKNLVRLSVERVKRERSQKMECYCKKYGITLWDYWKDRKAM